MDKQRRQKRFQQKQRHIERQFNIRKTNNFTWGYNNNEEQKHRFHKMKGWTCHSGCSICGNPRTYWGAKTLQETRFECSAVEQTNRDSIGKWEWEDLNDPRMEW